MKRPSLTIISPGAWNFASYLYPVLDCEYSPNNLPVPTDIGFMFGMFMGQWDFFTPLRDCKRKVAMWIGTDVVQLRQTMENKPEVVTILNTWLDVRLADAQNLADELTELGVKIDGVVETPPRFSLEPMPLPKQFTVGLYQPAERAEFYHLDLSLRIARAMPDVQFFVYGLFRQFDERDPAKNRIADNVWDLGFIRIDKEIGGMSALARFTKHDGIAIGPVEFMMAARRVVTNQPIPFAVQCEASLEPAMKILRQFQDETEPDTAASAYWRKRLSHEKWKEQIEGYIYG